jgi:hypothetical protein
VVNPVTFWDPVNATPSASSWLIATWRLNCGFDVLSKNTSARAGVAASSPAMHSIPAIAFRIAYLQLRLLLSPHLFATNHCQIAIDVS